MGPVKIKSSKQQIRTTYEIFQVRNTAWLAETAIYVATVDKLSDILKAILDWVKENREHVGQIKKINADCILHAALTDDKDQVD